MLAICREWAGLVWIDQPDSHSCCTAETTPHTASGTAWSSPCRSLSPIHASLLRSLKEISTGCRGVACHQGGAKLAINCRSAVVFELQANHRASCMVMSPARLFSDISSVRCGRCFDLDSILCLRQEATQKVQSELSLIAARPNDGRRGLHSALVSHHLYSRKLRATTREISV